MKYNTNSFIEKANKIHNNKYDYSLVKYIDSKSNIDIICKIHSIFKQIPANHIRTNNSRGCPSCAKNRKLTTKIFIEKANIIHNNKYDYSLVNYINANSIIKIICPTHGIFEQKAFLHLKKCGCQICGNNKKLTNETFIEKVNKIHNNKYDYSLVNYENSHKKIKIVCPTHGIFEQKPNNHLNGANCPKCIKLIHIKQRTLSTNEFIIKANIIHNSKYDYSKTKYIKSNHIITIICPEHGMFKQIASSHLAGHGCPNCNESKGEQKIIKFLNDNKITYIYQKTFNDCKNNNNRKLKFDFFIPNKNVLIEYDGKQHYEPIEYFGGVTSFEKLNEYDKIKNQYAKINDYNLIRISYLDYNNISNILKFLI